MEFSEIRLQIKPNFSSPIEIYIININFIININNIKKNYKLILFILILKKTIYKLILFIY